MSQEDNFPIDDLAKASRRSRGFDPIKTRSLRRRLESEACDWLMAGGGIHGADAWAVCVLTARKLPLLNKASPPNPFFLPPYRAHPLTALFHHLASVANSKSN